MAYTRMTNYGNYGGLAGLHGFTPQRRGLGFYQTNDSCSDGRKNDNNREIQRIQQRVADAEAKLNSRMPTADPIGKKILQGALDRIGRLKTDISSEDSAQHRRNTWCYYTPHPAHTDFLRKMAEWTKEVGYIAQNAAQEADMAALRAQMANMKSGGQTIIKQFETKTVAAPTASASGAVAAVKAADRAEKLAKEGGEVKGSGGKTVKEALAPGKRQTRFMRSTNKPGANLHPDHWKNLAKLAPANFDEQKYLAKHADVAKAVKMKAMPSGLWHYVKYGKTEGRALAGYRRPGFLAGIFANWNQIG